MRIFAPEQIEVHRDFPKILKDYSKEVIRNAPENVVKFSREYFEAILKEQGYSFDGAKPRQEVITASEKTFVWHARSARIFEHYSILDEYSEAGVKRNARIATHLKTGVERVVI